VGPAPTLVVALVAALALSQGWLSRTDAPFVPSDSREQTVVWAVGDGADGGRNARRVARLIRSSRPDRLLYLGDVYERGTATEFTNNFDSIYGRLAKRTAPTPGNHEWPLHASGYDRYWERKRGRRTPPYYSFEGGGWQILSLNSESDHGAGSKQVAWLRSKVRDGGTCRLAFWHRPRYSAGDVHGDQRDTRPLWDALGGHAAIVLAGHEHDMQRFRPRDGITELVSGAGGHGLFSVHARRDLAFANATRFGALRLALSPGLARFRFVAVGGRTLDAGKVRCRESRVAGPPERVR
jgi:Calcineurin-like phosphoesterase